MTFTEYGRGRILSIQSHVAFGYVGGKAAVFPLQCLGFDVDVVSTVNYSNHAGYGRSGGSKTSAAELTSIFEGMEKNEMLSPDRLLTGYVPNAEGLNAIADLAARLKKHKPELVYLLDPVMGDAGRLYVAPDVIPVYRRMLSLATVITPNWFEVETLTGINLQDMTSLLRAFDLLHREYNVPNVAMSSIPLKSWLAEALPSHIRPSSDNPNIQFLLCITSSVHGGASTKGISQVHAHAIPLLPGYFSGVGDLFSALLLGHYDSSKLKQDDTRDTPLSSAASHALTKTYAILQMTHEHSFTLPQDHRQSSDDELDLTNPLRRSRRMKGRELRLIQSQDIIRGVTKPGLRQMQPWDEFWRT